MDDDGTVRHALTRVIQGHGLATIEAGSGAEALAILEREGEIPLCISDVHMAEMDGVSPARSHQVLAGAVVAEATMRRLGVDELDICPWALREGVILRRLDVLDAA